MNEVVYVYIPRAKVLIGRLIASPRDDSRNRLRVIYTLDRIVVRNSLISPISQRSGIQRKQWRRLDCFCQWNARYILRSFSSPTTSRLYPIQCVQEESNPFQWKYPSFHSIELEKRSTYEENKLKVHYAIYVSTSNHRYTIKRYPLYDDNNNWNSSLKQYYNSWFPISRISIPASPYNSSRFIPLFFRYFNVYTLQALSRSKASTNHSL